MREILFRGKSTDTGAWVYGCYCGPFGYFDEHEICDIADPTCSRVDVDPDTVGQYTGLTDKNGKRIFEGDIVEGHCHSAWSHRLQRCVIAYGRDGFEARHHIGGIDSEYYTYRVLFSKDVEVIGNIYDQKELLDANEV